MHIFQRFGRSPVFVRVVLPFSSLSLPWWRRSRDFSRILPVPVCKVPVCELLKGVLILGKWLTTLMSLSNSSQRDFASLSQTLILTTPLQFGPRYGGPAKRMAGGKHTKECTLPKISGPHPEELLVCSIGGFCTGKAEE